MSLGVANVKLPVFMVATNIATSSEGKNGIAVAISTRDSHK